MYTSQNHTFSICAYKESPYLEEVILSLKKQTVSSNIIISTSTPNQLIQDLSEKYQIPLFIREGKSDIALDWNFAYANANTSLVTICHQDDLYLPNYLAQTLSKLNHAGRPLISFSDYGELRNDVPVYKNTLLGMKRIMLLPLYFSAFSGFTFNKRLAISFGNAICCPAVTYVKENLPDKLFKKGFSSNIDWETWEMLSKKPGSFEFIRMPLMLHRIHEESTTSKLIESDGRLSEDYEMFCHFWPKWFAKLISRAYKNGEKSNDTF